MTYEEEICQRLRSNAHTERELGKQSGTQAQLDYANLLLRAADVIEAQEHALDSYRAFVKNLTGGARGYPEDLL